MRGDESDDATIHFGYAGKASWFRVGSPQGRSELIAINGVTRIWSLEVLFV